MNRDAHKPPPVVLAPEQARNLMTAAEEYENGEMVGFFAVSLCLLESRASDEAGGMLWKHAQALGDDENVGHIYVPESDAKTSVDRYITVSDNLRAWLEPRVGDPAKASV